jgi:outer membrane protein assembly factor BamD (BamD/ComL family)
MNTRLAICAIACIAATLAACNSAKSDWNEATAANTVAAYQRFLQQHPGDKQADDAKGRILALKDDQAWSRAQAADTLDAYQAYLTAESGGVHVGDAKYHITALHRAADWKAIPADASAAALQAFLTQYPQGVESNEARARLKQLDYRVQLADLHSEAAAEHKRQQLESRFGAVLHELRIVPPSSADKLFSVASEPMSQAMAGSACEKIERAHQSCKVVQTAG